MKKQIEVTTTHLDRALAQPWATHTCLLAQAVAEAFDSPVMICGRGVAKTGSGVKAYFDDSATRLQDAFDAGHGRTHDAAALVALRAQLPVTIEVEYNAK